MSRIIALGLLYFWAIVNLSDSMMAIGLYVAVPGAFVLSFICAKDNIFRNKYFKIFVLFFSWITFTWLFALDTDVATRQIQKLAGVFMLTTALCNLATDRFNRKWLYGLYVVVFLIALNYARENILTIQYNIATDRLDDDRLNANILANYTVYATFALYVLGDIIKKRWVSFCFKILFLAMIPTSFVIAILTASRQVLLVQTPLLALLLYLRYFKQAKMRVKMFSVFIGIVTFFGVAGYVSETYEHSFLKVRNETNIEDDGRFKVLTEAINVGNKYPLTGVGPGNFYLLSSNRIFSHCSYTEAYANCGVIGVFIYIYLIGYFLLQQWKNFRITRNKMYLIYGTFGVIYALYNFFYVFYSDLWLMSFFVFVAFDSCNLKKNYHQIKTMKSNA